MISDPEVTEEGTDSFFFPVFSFSLPPLFFIAFCKFLAALETSSLVVPLLLQTVNLGLSYYPMVLDGGYRSTHLLAEFLPITGHYCPFLHTVSTVGKASLLLTPFDIRLMFFFSSFQFFILICCLEFSP